MPTELLMPALSPTMEEGTLSKWLVKEGDTVNAGDLLAEIETDKAVMEFEAVDEGVIGKLLVADGTEAIKVNTPIAVLLDDGESTADIVDADSDADKPASPKDKAPRDEPSTSPEPKKKPKPEPKGNRIFASPLARRIAADKGLDLAGINGTGPHGRIVKSDVEDMIARPGTVGGSVPSPLPATATSTDLLKAYEGRDYTEIPLDGMRKIIAARLTQAKQTIPHFYLRREIRLDALLDFRAELNRQLASRDIKLSVNDFIIKACALALQQVPAANAIWAGDRIVQLKPSDVAVAVAIEGGLFTPVLKDADTKTLTQLSQEMKDLADRARDRKLAPQEYQGGSFAISNLGMYGIDSFDAVINPPHGAILAVGAGVRKPVVEEDGTLAAATVLSMTLSVDHRVIDGALGADLLSAIKDNLESPMAMLA